MRVKMSDFEFFVSLESSHGVLSAIFGFLGKFGIDIGIQKISQMFFKIFFRSKRKSNIFFNPQHEYTKKLVNFQNKKKNSKTLGSKKILEVNKLKVWYPIKKGIFRRIVGHVKAVDSINLTLFKNQTLGIVGESGSGKTSLVLALLKLISFKGDVIFNEKHILKDF